MLIIEKLHGLWYNTREKVLCCKTFGELRSRVRDPRTTLLGKRRKNAFAGKHFCLYFTDYTVI